MSRDEWLPSPALCNIAFIHRQFTKTHLLAKKNNLFHNTLLTGRWKKIMATNTNFLIWNSPESKYVIKWRQLLRYEVTMIVSCTHGLKFTKKSLSGMLTWTFRSVWKFYRSFSPVWMFHIKLSDWSESSTELKLRHQTFRPVRNFRRGKSWPFYVSLSPRGNPNETPIMHVQIK